MPELIWQLCNLLPCALPIHILVSFFYYFLVSFFYYTLQSLFLSISLNHRYTTSFKQNFKF